MAGLECATTALAVGDEQPRQRAQPMVGAVNAGVDAILISGSPAAMSAPDAGLRWRAVGPYRPNNSSKAGLLEETRQFLLAYGRLGDAERARAELVDGALPQRARATRVTIARLIGERLLRWRPPAWVLDDLVGFARDAASSDLATALLLHAARQDRLLYDVAQGVIVPRWLAGERAIARADVQRFLDEAEPAHPEIARWSRQTREKLAGNLLTILRDYGLLRGKTRVIAKEIVEPVISAAAARHLARLLEAEGVADAALASHPDWRLWLVDEGRVRQLLAAVGARA